MSSRYRMAHTVRPGTDIRDPCSGRGVRRQGVPPQSPLLEAVLLNSRADVTNGARSGKNDGMGLFSKRSASAESAPPPRLSELTDVERNWMASLLAIVADSGTDVDDAAQIRALYDDSVMRWHRVNPPERVNPSPMINAIGIAIGEHVVRRTSLRWTLGAVDGRTELGLVDGASHVLVYPTELVAVRWRAQQGGEFVIETVERLTDRFPRAAGRRRA